MRLRRAIALTAVGATAALAGTALAANPTIGTYLGKTASNRADVGALGKGKQLIMFFVSPKCGSKFVVHAPFDASKPIKITKSGDVLVDGQNPSNREGRVPVRVQVRQGDSDRQVPDCEEACVLRRLHPGFLPLAVNSHL